MTYHADDLATPYQPVVHPEYRLPTGLKVLAVVVSGVKAVPLLIAFVGLVVIGAIFSSESNGNGVGETVAAIAAVLAIVVGVVAVLAGILLVGQGAAALRNRRTGLAVFSGILSAIDLVVVVVAAIGSLSDASLGPNADSAGDAAGGLVLVTVVAVAQVSILIWAVRSAPRPAGHP